MIWQNSCLSVKECASDLAELPVPVIWQNCLYVGASDLAELSVCLATDLEIACMWRSLPVIWQNCCLCQCQ